MSKVTIEEEFLGSVKEQEQEFYCLDLLLDLSKLRKKRNITQKQLSKKTGIPQSKISNYENFRSFPRINTLQKILLALDARLTIKNT